MASRTLPFPATSGFSRGSNTARRLSAQTPRLDQGSRFTPADTPRVRSSGRSTRLHVVDRASGTLLDRTRGPGSFSPAAQAQRVAAQVEWEIARQASRRAPLARPTGTLLLLPVRVMHPSLRSRAARALLRLLSPHRPLST